LSGPGQPGRQQAHQCQREHHGAHGAQQLDRHARGGQKGIGVGDPGRRAGTLVDHRSSDQGIGAERAGGNVRRIQPGAGGTGMPPQPEGGQAGARQRHPPVGGHVHGRQHGTEDQCQRSGEPGQCAQPPRPGQPAARPTVMQRRRAGEPARELQQRQERQQQPRRIEPGQLAARAPAGLVPGIEDLLAAVQQRKGAQPRQVNCGRPGQGPRRPHETGGRDHEPGGALASHAATTACDASTPWPASFQLNSVNAAVSSRAAVIGARQRRCPIRWEDGTGAWRPTAATRTPGF